MFDQVVCIRLVHPTQMPPLQASLITIEPNPSKKPTGGVPIFQVPSMFDSQVLYCPDLRNCKYVSHLC